MSLIVILRRLVELGRVDIAVEVSFMASHTKIKMEEHIAAVFHVFDNLWQKYNSQLLIDPEYPTIDRSLLKVCNRREFMVTCNRLYHLMHLEQAAMSYI